MLIETKYNIGDVAYSIYGNVAKKGRIVEVYTNTSEQPKTGKIISTIGYSLMTSEGIWIHSIPEQSVATTKQGLIDKVSKYLDECED